MIQPRGDLLAFVSDNLGKPTHKVMGKGSVRVMEYRSDDIYPTSRGLSNDLGGCGSQRNS
jgi:hypothetical protein